MLLLLLRLFVYVSVKSYQIKFFESCRLFIHDVSISSDDNRVTLSNKFYYQNKNHRHRDKNKHQISRKLCWKSNPLTVISLLQGMVYPQVPWPQRSALNRRSSRLRSQVQWPRQQLQAASILYLGFRHHSPFWVLMAFHPCLIQRLPKVLCHQDFPQVFQVSFYNFINFLLANSLHFAIFQAWWTFIPHKHYWT